MSPLWLLLIVPAAFTAGYVLCGFIANGEQVDRCTRCIQRRQEKEKE